MKCNVKICTYCKIIIWTSHAFSIGTGLSSKYFLYKSDFYGGLKNMRLFCTCNKIQFLAKASDILHDCSWKRVFLGTMIQDWGAISSFFYNSVQRWPHCGFVHTKYNLIPSSSLVDCDWKNTASLWWHIGQEWSLVLGKVGSWATSAIIWVNSSTSCTILLTYMHMLSACIWKSQLRHEYIRMRFCLSSFGYNILLHSWQNLIPTKPGPVVACISMFGSRDGN